LFFYISGTQILTILIWRVKHFLLISNQFGRLFINHLQTVNYQPYLCRVMNPLTLWSSANQSSTLK